MTTKWGRHLGISGHSIVESIQHILDLGGNAMQIFISPNRGSGSGRVITAQEAKTVKGILKSTGVYLVIHGKYILNFCSPKVSWYHDALVSDLKKASQMGDTVGVVIHQGKNKPEFKQTRAEAIKTYVGHLERVLDATSDISNPIVLENSCQQGNEIGYTLEELAEIYHTFGDKYKKRVKFCLDTCHIFVAGTLQFKSREEVDEFMNRFDKLIGLEKLEVIHFNDSKTPFDGHNDHHHDLGKGYIASNEYISTVKKYQKMGEAEKIRGSEAGLRHIVRWANKYAIPLILETPLEDTEAAKEIEKLGDWVREEGSDVGKKSAGRKKLVFKKKAE